MSPIPPPAVDQEDGLVPVTVCVTPAQAVRLEVLLAAYRERYSIADDSEVIDANVIPSPMTAK